VLKRMVLSTTYKIVSNILLSSLSPYIDEIAGDHQCGFRSNRSRTEQFFFFFLHLSDIGEKMVVQ
jgi:hypothetical protein